MRTVIKLIAIIGLSFLLSGCLGIDAAKVRLENMLFHLEAQIEPLLKFIFALSYVLGFCFIVAAVLKLKQYGQMTVMMATHASFGPAVAYFIVGVGLLYFPTLLDVMSYTVWQQGIGTVYNYEVSGTGHFGDIMVPITKLVQLVGFISFLRGWLMLARLGHQGGQPGTLAKGIIHMMAGILAINIVGTIRILQETFGLV